MKHRNTIACVGALAALSLGFADIPPESPAAERCTRADIDGSAAVDVVDLITLLSDWGPCDPSRECVADICGPKATPPDGMVDVNDLLDLLQRWGPCYPAAPTEPIDPAE